VQQTKILVVEDDDELREAIVASIAELGAEVESARDGVEGLERLAEGDAPSAILLDIRMPRKNGMEVLRALHQERLATRVVLLAAAFEDDQVLEALRLGARGMVLKELAPPLLIECVRRVHAGGQWIEQQASGRALETLIRRDAAEKAAGRELTPREIELVRLAASGLRNREMSRRLEISEGTVKMHLHNVYRKLKLENRVALANYARRKGLL